MIDLLARLGEHLQVLVEQIGERPGGSAANHEAIAYLTRILSAAGWDVEEQWFPCPAWVDLGTQLRANGRALAAATNAFSPPCAVQAPLCAVSTLAELREADMDGRVALLYGDILPAPLSPKSWFLLSEREAEIIALLEQKRPAALLTVQRFGGGLERLIEDWEFDIPSATIDAESARDLLQMPRGVEIDLRIESSRTAGRTANVVARSRAGEPRVVLCAHHDTKFGTPGALDNGSGTAVMLTLAEMLDPARYPFALEWVFFANEEYLPIGDDEYLRCQGGEDLSQVLACINVDGAGLCISPDSITAISAEADLIAGVEEIIAANPGIIWVEPWPESNHSTFAWRGVPSIAFTSAMRTSLAHHPQDNLRWLDVPRLATLTGVIVDTLDLVAQPGLSER